MKRWLLSDLRLVCGYYQVRQLLQKEKGHVIASCRDPLSAADLSSLKDQHAGRLTLLPLDVTKENTIEVNHFNNLVMYYLL